jgi:ketopantoate reductase
MKIGIIGAGSIGRAFAAHVAKVDYDVVTVAEVRSCYEHSPPSEVS